MMKSQKVYIGELLVKKQLITQEQLDAAVAQHNATGERLGQALINLGFIKENTLLQILAEQLHIPYVDLKNYKLHADVMHVLSEFDSRRFRAIVLNSDENGYLVGMVDPQDVLANDELARLLKKPMTFALVRESDLLDMIDLMYRHTDEISSLATELSEDLHKNDYDISQLDVGLSTIDAPVVKMLQTIFDDAVKVNASDVHIEPDENLLRIRLRIDGVLHEQILREKNVAQALTLRLKLMAGLNIAEKRLPQDGRFSIKIKGKNFDVRLSTMPVQYGESVVMRLLNQSAGLLELEHVGLPDDTLLKLSHTITLPNGLLLVTGPTGSGKTTTLYGILNRLNTTEKKIITVEDPVEYRISRINQVQVQPRIDLTFSRVLRSVLRQDPDIIMVGELRDQETVAIALRAALTGHFVLSTLHTNDAATSAIRLIDMGAEGYLVAAVLRAVIAQRLVRRVCDNCAEDYQPTPQELAWLKATEDVPKNAIFKQGVGCTYCHNTGFRGQIGIFEFLEITPALAEQLRLNNSGEFARIIREQKMYRPLLLTGFDLAEQGVTTLGEVIRITGENIFQGA